MIKVAKKLGPLAASAAAVNMRFAEHVDKWEGCQRCELREGRCRVVHARGALPADCVFIAEAPGVSEDVLGVPLIGPAGKLLDQIVDAAGFNGGAALPGVRCFFANLVGCFPAEAKANGTNEPPDAAVKACAPRLQELLRLADGPAANRVKLIVCVGTMARDWLDPKRRGRIAFHREFKMVDITHPAALLRANLAQQSLMVQRCVVTLATALREMER
jgi:DNA polymerase